jgi:hypothetical protein
MRGKKIIPIIVLILNGINLFCQNTTFQEIRSKVEVDSKSDIISGQKLEDTLFINASIIVLKSYSELMNIKFEFIQKNIKTMMAARPAFGTVLKKREKRSYKIIISTNPSNNSEQLFHQISINAYVGILSHEFAHLTCYNNKTSLQLIIYGIGYYFNRRKIERETDQIAIQHGFGKELLEYNRFIYNCNLVSKKYLNNKKKNYLSINEIEMIIDK